MIQPPGWAKHAVPKPNGWHDPRTDELLKSVRLSTDQINEYNGITSEPEVLTEEEAKEAEVADEMSETMKRYSQMLSRTTKIAN